MEKSSRRDFLGSAAGLGLTLGFPQGSRAQDLNAEPVKFELSPVTQQLLSRFELTYPIFQAGFGSASSPEVAIAVSKAGAMGGMALWMFSADQAAARVAKVFTQSSANGRRFGPGCRCVIKINHLRARF